MGVFELAEKDDEVIFFAYGKCQSAGNVLANSHAHWLEFAEGAQKNEKEQTEYQPCLPFQKKTPFKLLYSCYFL
jgi:hypothetical protein